MKLPVVPVADTPHMTVKSCATSVPAAPVAETPVMLTVGEMLAVTVPTAPVADSGLPALSPR